MILELIICFFSIFGAFGLSSMKKENRILGYFCFIISNFFIIYLSINTKIYPLTLQMILLSIFSIIGIYNLYYNKNYTINLYSIILYYTLLFSLLFFLIDYKEYFSQEVHKFEVMLSLIVLIGNSFIATTNENLRIKGFYLFILADVGYLFLYTYYSFYIMILTTLFFFIASFKAVLFLRKNLILQIN